MRKFAQWYSFVVLLSAVSAYAVDASPRMLIHLLDYIALDYGGAVQNGKVVSASEYAEQLEFAETAKQTALAVPELSNSPAIQTGMDQLVHQLAQKAAAADVAKTARKIEVEVLRLSRVQMSPDQWPDLHRGKANYDKNCAQCHGTHGYGDGPSGGNLDPKPANFFDPKMDSISPFQMFNTIRLGVPGTAMAAFDSLSDSETWDLAFYVASLRHGKFVEGSTQAPIIDLKNIAERSDLDLKGNYPPAVVAAARLHSVQAGGDSSVQIGIIRSNLSETLRLFKMGNFDAAKSKAIAAYLDGVEPIEPKLRLESSVFTASLESNMAQLRNQIDQRVSHLALEATLSKIELQLNEARELLAKGTSSAAVTFTVAAGIILREAFEAALLLITLLGVIRTLGTSRANLYVHGGWLLAVVFGVVCWFFSGWVMGISGMQRELLEGATALLAVVILLYFGFWLHRKSEIGKWHSFINEMVSTAMSQKKLLGLGAVAFMGVFREAFETVLFLRALLLQSPEQENSLYMGVLAAFISVLFLSTLAVRYSARLPIQKLFTISSVTMIFLAFILIGKSVHSFQEAGLLRISEMPMTLRWDWLGLYATYESFLPQFILLMISLIVWKSSYASRKISSNE